MCSVIVASASNSFVILSSMEPSVICDCIWSNRCVVAATCRTQLFLSNRWRKCCRAVSVCRRRRFDSLHTYTMHRFKYWFPPSMEMGIPLSRDGEQFWQSRSIGDWHSRTEDNMNVLHNSIGIFYWILHWTGRLMSRRSWFFSYSVVHRSTHFTSKSLFPLEVCSMKE